ncbi:MAG: hypothetical protein U0270_41765 [Labilithrix sp.]
MAPSRLSACAVVAAITSASGSVAPSRPPRPGLVAPRPSIALASLREQTLDTDVEPPPRVRPPRPAPAPAPPPSPNRPVRTPRDEDLPAWVPITGRLTVVESCDLAENLGLAPPGTARSGACPSVAALLEAERPSERRGGIDLRHAREDREPSPR